MLFILCSMLCSLIFLWIITDPSIIDDELHSKIIGMFRIHRDKTGQKPGDVVNMFIEAAQAGRYEDAAQYWTPESLNSFQQSKHYRSFESYCQIFQHMRFHHIFPPIYDAEGQTYWVEVKGRFTKTGRIESRWFFLILVNDRYVLNGQG